MWQAIAENSPLDWGFAFLRTLRQSGAGKPASHAAPVIAPRAKLPVPIHTPSNAIN